MSALSRVSRTEGDKHHTVPLRMESKMRHKMGFPGKRKPRPTHAENRLVVAKGRRGGSGGLGLEIGRHKLVYREWTNKVLLNSTGKCIQYP